MIALIRYMKNTWTALCTSGLLWLACLFGSWEIAEFDRNLSFFTKFQINTCKILKKALILANLKVTIFGNSCKWSRSFSKRYSSPDVLIHSPPGSKEFCQSESELSLVMSLSLTSSKLNYLRQHKDSFLTSPQ